MSLSCQNLKQKDTNNKHAINSPIEQPEMIDTIIKGIRFEYSYSTELSLKAIKSDIEKEVNVNFCDQKGGEVIIIYKIYYSSETNISIIKTVSIHCPALPSDVWYKKGLNFSIKESYISPCNFSFSPHEKVIIAKKLENSFDSFCLEELTMKERLNEL